MLLDEVAGTSAAVAASSARLAKVELLAACLRRLEPDEVHPAVAFLSGDLRQRQIGVGWAALRDAPDPASEPTLTVTEVDAAFERIGRLAGPGSQTERRRLVGELFGRATASEQRFLVGLLSGELRQGALEGVMAEAIAKAAGVPGAEVRRAMMLRGALGPVAEAALAAGVPALREFHLQVGRPLQPMLASTAPSVEAAMERVGEAAVEWKLDGARVQVHRDGGEVAVFTRTLDDITARVPEVVAAALALQVGSAVLDGEVIALHPDGRPHPFQVTASRVGSRLEVERLAATLPLTVFLFDPLHLDGQDLLDRQGAERHAALAATVPEPLRIPRTVTADPAAAAAFLADALARGHEGVMVKSLAATWEAGRRGAGWIKVKPVHTLDLVVLAVEWGHGRRKGLAQQPPPWRPRSRYRRVRDARQDVQGPDRQAAGLADRAPAGAGRRPDRPVGRAGPSRAGGRGRLRRGAGQPPLSGRGGPALRPGPALPPRQAARGGRHHRDGSCHPHRRPAAGPGRDALSRSRTGPHLDTVRGRCDPAGWARRGSEHRDHR